MYIDSDKLNGIIKITESFTSSAPTFSSIGDTYIKSIMDLDDVEKFKSFDYNSSGTNNSRYLKTTYRLSRNNVAWTNWIDLSDDITNFPPFDPKDTMYIDLKWERVGTSDIGTINLTDYILMGSISRNITDGESIISLTTNKSIVIKPPFIYKVFKITDLEILSKGDISNTNISYRFSQDYGRTVSDWEPLTKENITTVRINPIRFFQIEYLVEYIGSSSIKIFDINLIGDFQNVTLDSNKTNLYGIRENCNCIMLDVVGGTSSTAGDGATNLLMGSTCDTNGLPVMSPDDIAKLFQPYQQNQAVDLLNKLGNDANQIFGHDVVYFITDPDKRGIDFSFHEYQLYNYVCSEMIKVSVDGNNFPDNQIVMNQFDLSLFDSFEIHIPKETFKKSFGVEKRPSKEDFLWFCNLNRMYQIEHAQQFRSFNNSALYYKVMLKKYVQKSNIIGVNQTITDKVKELTKNSTIDELFGLENNLDKKDTSNKEQLRPLTQDLLRIKINSDIDKELIENSTTIISKSNYDLSSVDYQGVAVMYRGFRRIFKKSDNFSFTIWFNIHNYTVNDMYNFIYYYDETYSKGFKINLESDNIRVNLNSDIYDFNVTLDENIWYCYVVNFDQRKRKINQFVYKRNSDTENESAYLDTNLLKLVGVTASNMNAIEFELDETNITIFGSDMKATNIRLFSDIIPESEHNKILNQYIIGNDYRYLIFADNANTRIILPKYSYNQLNTNIIRGEVTKIDASTKPTPNISNENEYIGDDGYIDDDYFSDEED